MYHQLFTFWSLKSLSDWIRRRHRRRPEYWYGVAWLPEFWLTVVLGVGLVWSVWRDWTRLVRRYRTGETKGRSIWEMSE